MGYRANVITQHREYGAQTFSSWEMFTSDFIPAMDEAGVQVFGNENEDFYEVDKTDLQKFVDEMPDDGEPSIYPDYTNSDLKQELQDAIDDSKGSWVSWEWF